MYSTVLMMLRYADEDADVFYGIDNAALCRWGCRCILQYQYHISPQRQYITTTTHLQVDSEAPRPILPRQATGKLSLSSQSSSAALMTHPTPGKPPHFPLWTKFPLRLLIFLSALSLLVIPPIIQNFSQEESDAICSLLTCNPSRHRHSIPSALKSQPVRRVLPVTGLCRRGAAS